MGFSRIFLVFSGTLSGIFLEIFCVSFLEFSVLFLGFSGIFTPFPSCSFFFPPVPRREDERGRNSGNPPQSEALPGKNSILFLFLIFPGAQALPIKNSLGWNVQILGISSSCPFADIQERPKFFFLFPTNLIPAGIAWKKKSGSGTKPLSPSQFPNSEIPEIPLYSCFGILLISSGFHEFGEYSQILAAGFIFFQGILFSFSPLRRVKYFA